LCSKHVGFHLPSFQVVPPHVVSEQWNIKQLDDTGADIAVVRRYLDALRNRGTYAGTAVHISADNLDTIGRAFDEVSAKMADSQMSVL